MQLWRELTERFHLLEREIVQQQETLYDRLYFPVDEIPERYLRQNLSVALKLRLQHGVTSCRINARIIYIPSHDIHRELESACIEGDGKFFMFIPNVELLDDQKKAVVRAGGVIGLEFLDQVPHPRVGNSIYLSFVTGKHVIGCGSIFENGKLDKTSILAGFIVRGGEQPSDMIEARPEMMNDLSGQYSKAERDRAIPVILDLLKEKLFVILAENGVVAFIKKPINLQLQIEDVLLGPL
jgi:hypothetical protein